ncbi:MFS general substrate transporter [Aspergillus ambiguus]|uniref:MFS transporter n=1 Tax=Aspergillus ambiguus TaxID=176160 RepID=UPI003CCCF61F
MVALEKIDDTLSRRPHTPKPPDDTPSPRNSTYNVSFNNGHNQTTPHEMSWLRKWVIVVLVCTGSLCVTCASSIYTTAYTQMNAELNASSTITTLGLSFFVLGIGSGPLLTGPLSERYGRSPIYLSSLFLFIIWNVTTAVAKNVQTILISRLLAGFAGGTFLSVSGGTVRDIFSRDKIQIPMILVSSAPFIGPCLGPLIGGFISYNAGWRWNFYLMVIWSSCLLLGIVCFVPETNHPINEKAKARVPRKKAGVERQEAFIETTHPARRKTLALSLLRPFQLLLLEPMCLALDIYSAILLGILYLFFQAFPHLFKTTYGFNGWQVGLTFLGIILGMIVAATSSPLWHRLAEGLSNIHGDKNCEATPEQRLVPAIPGSVLISVGLFWFGWTISPNIHWIVPVFGSAIFGCGMLLTFTGIFTFLVYAYSLYAASALAGNGFVRCSFAAAFPLFGVQMYDRLGFHWATSLLAFLTVSMMPLPWLFLKYGKKLRAKSRFALGS